VAQTRRKPDHEGDAGSGLQTICGVGTGVDENLRLHVLIGFAHSD